MDYFEDLIVVNGCYEAVVGQKKSSSAEDEGKVDAPVTVDWGQDPASRTAAPPRVPRGRGDDFHPRSLISQLTVTTGQILVHFTLKLFHVDSASS